jgi:tetratricopeptide (TPR) repeat protein
MEMPDNSYSTEQYAEQKQRAEQSIADARETIKRYTNEYEKRVKVLEGEYDEVIGEFNIRQEINRRALLDNLTYSDRESLLVPCNERIRERIKIVNNRRMEIQGCMEGARDALSLFQVYMASLCSYIIHDYKQSIEDERAKGTNAGDEKLENLEASLLLYQDDWKRHSEAINPEFPPDILHIQWSGTQEEQEDINITRYVVQFRCLKYFGFIYSELRDLKKAIRYYERALEVVGRLFEITKNNEWNNEKQEIINIIDDLKSK